MSGIPLTNSLAISQSYSFFHIDTHKNGIVVCRSCGWGGVRLFGAPPITYKH